MLYAYNIPPSIHLNKESISVKRYHYPLKRLLCRIRGKKQYEEQSLLWSDVSKATAYKRDVFAHDLICIHLATNEGIGMETHERMANWEEFVNKLPTNLPGSQHIDDWFREVAFPAFEENALTIYSRVE